MTSIWSAERQGASQGERELGDMNLKLNIPVPEKEMEGVEECKTPTWQGNKIPSIPKCPSAPKKKRQPPPPPPLPPQPPSSSHNVTRSSASELCFFEQVWPGEIEFFFQSLNESARVNKRRKSI